MIMQSLFKVGIREVVTIMMTDMLFYMTLGMILGMVASPLLMRVIKVTKQRRKVSRILNEVSKLQKTGQLHNDHQVL